MPASWFNKNKTNNSEWNDIVAELDMTSKEITSLMVDKLVEALGERIVRELLPEVGDVEFLSWFKRFGTPAEDRQNGAL